MAEGLDLQDEGCSEGSDSDSESDMNVETLIDEHADSDTTAEQLLLGKDIQGIPWDRFRSREEHRKIRMRDYRNYTNVFAAMDPVTLRNVMAQLESICKQPKRDRPLYDFVRSYRNFSPVIVHFQLRHLMFATSGSDLFVAHENCVKHVNLALNTCTNVLNLDGHHSAARWPGGGYHRYSATERNALSRLPGVEVKVSTLGVKDELVAAGGFAGEMVCKHVGTGTILYGDKVTKSANGITNAIEIFDSARYGHCIMASNNDAAARLFDVPTMQVKLRFDYPWPVNYATVRPVHEDVAVVVGDDPVTYLTDLNSGKTVAQLVAHKDHSFAAAWHPNGYLLATGNQDTTAVVWDIRYLKAPFVVLKGHLGAVRTIRFSPDGRHMAMAEAADFVHLYDVASGFDYCQEIDLFGEIAGVSFAPDSHDFFVGVVDHQMNYRGILQYACHPDCAGHTDLDF